MSISKKDLKLLLYVGGILAIVLVYFNIFSPTLENNKILVQKNIELQAQVERLEELDKNKEVYLEETADMRSEIAEIYSIFPADIKEETTIMYANMLEGISDLEVSAIGISSRNQLYAMVERNVQADTADTTDAGTVAETAGQYAGEPRAALYDRQVTYTFTVSYEGFKKVVRRIQEETEKRNVENVTLSFDPSTGRLVGSMLVNMYAMDGSEIEKVYVEPEVPPMPLGTDNIFGTIIYSEESDDSLLAPEE